MTTVNGSDYQPRDGEMIRDLVAATTSRELDDAGQPVDGSRLGVAVAINEEIVPRTKWATTPVEGTIDIVTAVQGG